MHDTVAIGSMWDLGSDLVGVWLSVLLLALILSREFEWSI